MSKGNFNIASAFDNYVDIILGTESDINFWKSFLKISILNYQKQDITPTEIYSACFTAYNINVVSNQGFVASHKKTISIKTIDLEQHSVAFFNWIMNLSILKSYNAIEIFLFQLIWLRYYPAIGNPTANKKNLRKLEEEIKKHLKNSLLTVDITNNRHLIDFLKDKSKGFSDFIKKPVRVDLTTTWYDYFELLSIIRNAVAHQGALISLDTLNEIKSKAKDVFERYFSITTISNGDRYINPKEGNMTGLIRLMNDFTTNSAKFIYEESDFKFINLV